MFIMLSTLMPTVCHRFSCYSHLNCKNQKQKRKFCLKAVIDQISNVCDPGVQKSGGTISLPGRMHLSAEPAARQADGSAAGQLQGAAVAVAALDGARTPHAGSHLPAQPANTAGCSCRAQNCHCHCNKNRKITTPYLV